MTIHTNISGVHYIPHFIGKADELLNHLLQEVVWDTRMRARLTASFGKAYDYSQMNYPEQTMLAALAYLLPDIENAVAFCLIIVWLIIMPMANLAWVIIPTKQMCCVKILALPLFL